jgi:hypothetical protein
MIDKAAISYLASSGAAPIWISERGTIHAGGKITDAVAARWWIDARMAVRVARAARTAAGDNPDVSAATAALHRAAASLRVALTADNIAVERARNAAMRLDAYLSGRGVLRDFNAAFKQRREAAAMQGRGFMSYKAAEVRLRRALIPMLANGGTIGPRSLFSEIFDR